MLRKKTSRDHLAEKGWSLRFWEHGATWTKSRWQRIQTARLVRAAKRRDKRLDRKLRQMANYGNTLERIAIYASLVFLSGVAVGYVVAIATGGV